MAPPILKPPSFFDRHVSADRSPLQVLLDQERTAENLSRNHQEQVRKHQSEIAWQCFEDLLKRLRPGQLYAFAAIWSDVWGFDIKALIEHAGCSPGTFKVGYWRARHQRACTKPIGQCDGADGECIHAQGMRVFRDHVLAPATARIFDEVGND